MRAQIARFRRRFPVHAVTAAVVDEAVRGVEQHRLGYEDAQMWAVARLHQIEVVLGEDTCPGVDRRRQLDRPMRADFDVASV